MNEALKVVALGAASCLLGSGLACTAIAAWVIADAHRAYREAARFPAPPLVPTPDPLACYHERRRA